VTAGPAPVLHDLPPVWSLLSFKSNSAKSLASSYPFCTHVLHVSHDLTELYTPLRPRSSQAVHLQCLLRIPCLNLDRSPPTGFESQRCSRTLLLPLVAVLLQLCPVGAVFPHYSLNENKQQSYHAVYTEPAVCVHGGGHDPHPIAGVWGNHLLLHQVPEVLPTVLQLVLLNSGT
jgi:hypothetical protein